MNKLINKIYKRSLAAALFGTVVALGMTSCEEEKPEETFLPPTIENEGAKDLTRTSAVLTGSLKVNNPEIVSEYGVAYSTSADFPQDATVKVPIEKALSNGRISQLVTNLKPKQRYFYSIYATAGPSTLMAPYPSDFTTLSTSSPTFSEMKIDSIGEDLIRATCSVMEVGDEYLMEYGLSYKSDVMNAFVPVPAKKFVSEATKTFTVEIKGLKPDTKYIVRPYAKNSSSEDGLSGVLEGYGQQQVISTDKLLAPEVATREGKVGMTSIVISGEVLSATGSEGVINESGFCWSSTVMEPSILDEHMVVSNKELNKVFQDTIKNLKANTNYYVRAYAKNTVDGSERYGYGDVKMFTTINLETPKIELSTSETFVNSIKIEARIMNYEKDALVEKGYVWSKQDRNPTLETAGENKLIVKGNNEAIVGTIENLEPNTWYYIRAYAIYESSGFTKVGYSDFYHRTTDQYAYPNLTIQIKNITSQEATFQGIIDYWGNVPIVEKGFCWMEGEGDLTLETGQSAKANDDFEYIAKDLKYNTRYSVRPYVKCKIDETIKIVYSEGIQTFMTEGVKLPIAYNFREYEENSFSSRCEFILQDEAKYDVLEAGVCGFYNYEHVHLPSIPFEKADIMVPFTRNVNGIYSGLVEGLIPGRHIQVCVYVKIKFEGREYAERTLIGDSYSYGIHNWLDTRYVNMKQDGTKLLVSGQLVDVNLAENLQEVGVVWREEIQNNKYEEWDQVTTRQTVTLDSEGRFTTSIDGNWVLGKRYQVCVYIKYGTNKIGYSYYRDFELQRAPQEDDNDVPNKTEE